MWFNIFEAAAATFDNIDLITISIDLDEIWSGSLQQIVKCHDRSYCVAANDGAGARARVLDSNLFLSRLSTNNCVHHLHV